MQIILLEDLKNLGKKGDVKNVSDGYARNFLLPRKMAQIATNQAISEAETRKKKAAINSQENTEKLKELADTWKEKKVVIKSKEKDGKLFGSVSTKDIVKILDSEGLKIKESGIVLKGSIKKTGQYEVEIKLAQNISTKIILEIQGK